MSRNSFEARHHKIVSDYENEMIKLRGERYFTYEDVDALEQKIRSLRSDVGWWILVGAGAAFVITITICVTLHL